MNEDVLTHDHDPIQLDSTDAQAYTVLHEDQKDITHEIRKLVSLQTRVLKGK